MKDVLYRAILPLLFLCFLVSPSNAQQSTESQGLQTLAVSTPSWPGIGPLYLGKEKGIFQKHGIDLQITQMESMDTRRAALSSGAIDIDVTTLDQVVIYHNNGIKAQVIMLSDYSTGGDGIIARKEIR